jgi:uncharacterized protein (TIGR00730 family)
MKPNKTVKAYDNKKFLHSTGARSLRILSEYMEPDQRLQQLGVSRAVIFFGSARTSRGGKPDYYAAAADLAEKMARWTLQEHAESERCYICTGGGPGIMQAAHEGAARVDASLNIGLNISLPFEQHINPCVESERAFEFHYFFTRKFWFINLAAGAVIFPGGFGTMDELFELLTLTQTGKSARMPILLYGREFWTKVINFKLLAQRSLISPEDLDLFTVVNSVNEAFSKLTREVGASSSVVDQAAAAKKIRRLSPHS